MTKLLPFPRDHAQGARGRGRAEPYLSQLKTSFLRSLIRTFFGVVQNTMSDVRSHRTTAVKVLLTKGHRFS